MLPGFRSSQGYTAGHGKGTGARNQTGEAPRVGLRSRMPRPRGGTTWLTKHTFRGTFFKVTEGIGITVTDFDRGK
jgi:hypothetical protein